MRSATILVDAPAAHIAQVESWLLGHGRLPVVVPLRPRGRIRYVVTEADSDTIRQLRHLGCEVTKSAG